MSAMVQKCTYDSEDLNHGFARADNKFHFFQSVFFNKIFLTTPYASYAISNATALAYLVNIQKKLGAESLG